MQIKLVVVVVVVITVTLPLIQLTIEDHLWGLVVPLAVNMSCDEGKHRNFRSND